MGLFSKLRNLFRAGGSRQASHTDTGLYLYVRLERGGEVVRLRLEPRYELVPDDELGGYVTHKTIVGPLTYQRAEGVFRFDATRRLIAWDLSGGELVSEAEYLAQRDRA